MDPVELVRLVEGYRRWALVDVWESGKKLYPRTTFQAWPTNELRLEDPESSWKAAEKVCTRLIAQLRADGWKDELDAEEQAVIAARVAQQEADEAKAEAALAARIAAFPVTEVDRRLAAAIAKPKGVTALDLRGAPGNQITILPPSIGKLVELRSLILDDNALETFPEEMEHLKALVYFSAVRNRLVDDRPVCYSRNLRLFNIHGNRITQCHCGNRQKDLEVQMGGNPIEQLGWFPRTVAFGIDTDALFPIGDRVDKPSTRVKTIHLYGRAPTPKETQEAAKHFPRAELVHCGDAASGPRTITDVAELLGAAPAKKAPVKTAPAKTAPAKTAPVKKAPANKTAPKRSR